MQSFDSRILHGAMPAYGDTDDEGFNEYLMVQQNCYSRFKGSMSIVRMRELCLRSLNRRDTTRVQESAEAGGFEDMLELAVR